MPSNFGTTPLSTTTLGSNQFPVSGVFVPGTAGGNLTAVQGGPASTDGGGYTSAPVAFYAADGSNVTLGSKADAKNSATDTTAISIMQVLKQLSFQAQNPASTPVTGTFWQTTQPISAASLPLPTGAATSAKQPALGTAGTASTDVLSVQGIASMTPLKVDGSGVTQPVSGSVTANIGTTNGLALDTSVNGLLLAQGSTTSGQKGPLAQGAVTSSAPSYTTAQSSPLSLTLAGALRVDGSAVTQPVSGTFWQTTQPVSLASLPSLAAGTANIGGVEIFDSAGTNKLAIDGSGRLTLVPNSSVNVAQVAGTATSVNAGNRDAGTQRFIEAGNGAGTVTQVASAASDTSLLAANTNKKGTLFFNDSTAILYLLYGTGVASTTNYSVQIPSKAYFEDPLHYTGGFHGIWSAANGFVYCTEVS